MQEAEPDDPIAPVAKQRIDDLDAWLATPIRMKIGYTNREYDAVPPEGEELLIRNRRNKGLSVTIDTPDVELEQVLGMPVQESELWKYKLNDSIYVIGSTIMRIYARSVLVLHDPTSRLDELREAICTVMRTATIGIMMKPVVEWFRHDIVVPDCYSAEIIAAMLSTELLRNTDRDEKLIQRMVEQRNGDKDRVLKNMKKYKYLRAMIESERRYLGKRYVEAKEDGDDEMMEVLADRITGDDALLSQDTCGYDVLQRLLVLNSLGDEIKIPIDFPEGEELLLRV